MENTMVVSVSHIARARSDASLVSRDVCSAVRTAVRCSKFWLRCAIFKIHNFQPFSHENYAYFSSKSLDYVFRSYLEAIWALYKIFFFEIEILKNSSCGAVRCGVRFLEISAVRCGAVRCTIFRNLCGAVRCGAGGSAVRCGAVRHFTAPPTSLVLK